jgi:hypothetical protein
MSRSGFNAKPEGLQELANQRVAILLLHFPPSFVLFPRHLANWEEGHPLAGFLSTHLIYG